MKPSRYISSRTKQTVHTSYQRYLKKIEITKIVHKIWVLRETQRTKEDKLSFTHLELHSSRNWSHQCQLSRMKMLIWKTSRTNLSCWFRVRRRIIIKRMKTNSLRGNLMIWNILWLKEIKTSEKSDLKLLIWKKGSLRSTTNTRFKSHRPNLNKINGLRYKNNWWHSKQNTNKWNR